MSRPDAAASAALDEQHIRPIWLGYLDIVGDPLRANTSGKALTFSGATDPDLNATFAGINADLVDISPLRMTEGGSETVTAKLSGIRGPDTDLMNTMGDKANWQGRPIRLWRIIRNAAGEQQGAIQHYHTGYMMDCGFECEPNGMQTIIINTESYLAAFSQASNRTYLDQAEFDAGDLSAEAAIAIANGISSNPLVSNTPTGVAASIGGPFANLRAFRSIDI